MLILSRRQNEEIVIRFERSALAALREWLHRLPIDQERLTEGIELLDELQRIEITLVVLTVLGDKARIGVEAPRELIEIHRREVLERIEAQRRERRRVLETA